VWPSLAETAHLSVDLVCFRHTKADEHLAGVEAHWYLSTACCATYVNTAYAPPKLARLTSGQTSHEADIAQIT